MLALTGLLALAGGCAAPVGVATPPDDGRPVVLATFTVLADLATVVAGQDAHVTSITGPGQEIHGYEPTPDDLRRAAGADLLLANGRGLEAWLEDLVAPLDLPTVVLTDGLPEHRAVGVGYAGTELAPVDPHAWMSPRAGQHYARGIAAALGEIDPPHAADYRARAERYVAELEDVHDELARLAELPAAHRLLVTCEGAFGYLARDAGLDVAALWPVNSERQGTPRQVAAVIRTVRERDVPAVFCESTVAPTAQQQVARETGARFGGTLHVDSLSGPDGPVPTYLDLLRRDVAVIAAALGSEP
ncbi:MAG TPA: zinc ABC transporter substrate-binding protein [Actinotalea sp.]|nr:zinc ABC transporter substrate-binding protein [Actinotalea sp.]